VRPEEMEVPTKIGTFDDTIRLDKDETRELFNVLIPLLKANRDGEEYLWPFTSKELLTTWKAAGEILHLDQPFHLYALRHAGPSHDMAARLRPLIEIQQRGRWRSRSSLVRYEKHGRMQSEFEALPQATKAMCFLCRKHLLLCLRFPNAAPLHPMDMERAQLALEVLSRQ
jgi:hypothetical protein